MTDLSGNEIPVIHGHNYRADVMLAMTYVAIFVLIGVMIAFKVDANSAVGGIIILVVGKLLGNWGTAFDFEFGSSQKDKTGDDRALTNQLLKNASGK